MRKHWIVFIEDGFTKLMSPSGETFNQEIKGVLDNSIDLNEAGFSRSIYTATFEVKLAPNRDAATKMIEDAKACEKI